MTPSTSVIWTRASTPACTLKREQPRTEKGNLQSCNSNSKLFLLPNRQRPCKKRSNLTSRVLIPRIKMILLSSQRKRKTRVLTRGLTQKLRSNWRLWPVKCLLHWLQTWRLRSRWQSHIQSRQQLPKPSSLSQCMLLSHLLNRGKDPSLSQNPHRRSTRQTRVS